MTSGARNPGGLSIAPPEAAIIEDGIVENLLAVGRMSLVVGGWLLFSYTFVSFFEWVIHRHLMHLKRFPKWVYDRSPYLLETFVAHTTRHHHQWYKDFDHEPDPEGREDNLDIKIGETVAIMVTLAPIFALILWLSPLGGSILLATSVLHNRLWNFIHRQMHIPQNAFFKDWGLFRFLARNHFMHHQQPNRNFNVVFPLWDFLLGSLAKPKVSDVREMLRLGYIMPRREATNARLERWREAVAAERQAGAAEQEHAQAA